MKIVERLILDQSLTDDNIAYLRQLGVDQLTVAFLDMGVNDPTGRSSLSRLREGAYYELDDLVALKQWVEARGMTVAALGLPNFRRWDKVFFGLPGRDEQIEDLCRTVRNMGRAGIPILQSAWHYNAGAPIPLWRTSIEEGRGGAKITRFESALVQGVPPSRYGTLAEEDAWDNFLYFLRAIVPVAEESGVTLTIHPSDPQVPAIAGVARIVRSAEAYDRMLAAVPSPALAMTFCLGCFAQMMEPEAVYRAIDHFGRQGRIGYVHFRGVQGTPEKFDEVFPDEGKLDMIRTMRALRAAGYAGLVQPDHAPHVTGDTDYGHASHAFQIGYLRGVLQAAQTDGDAGRAPGM
ncbi:mannonate dehydratase [Pigmentiphaga soli]|uniref:mannonate dehydratase n=1 Tax=Pigmentiphaga soli TaxID=1007095 RepID=A0ABP8HS65_9BURK